MLVLTLKDCSRFVFISVFLILCFTAVKGEINTEEIKAEEIIAKHLDSIGSKDKRSAIKNQMAIGTSEFEAKLPTRKTTGKSIFVSESNNLMFLSSFRSNEYPYEKIGLFGGKINIPLALQNNRSPLGAFIADHSALLTEGLFTGSMSSLRWFLNSQIEKDTVQAGGTKKINGKKVYLLNYYPKTRSTDFTVKMFFDAETFQHLRTEYRDSIAPQSAPMGVLGTQTGVIISLTEEFGNFKAVDGLTLPHSYKIKYMTDSNSGTYEWNWGFQIEEYRFNENLKEGFFNFS